MYSACTTLSLPVSLRFLVKSDVRVVLIFGSGRSGNDGVGEHAGMAGKRGPLLSTGRFISATAIELATTAIRKPGKRGANLRSATMLARALAPTPMVAQLALGSAPRYACHLGRKSARSEERRVGKEVVSTGRARWSPSH